MSRIIEPNSLEPVTLTEATAILKRTQYSRMHLTDDLSGADKDTLRGIVSTHANLDFINQCTPVYLFGSTTGSVEQVLGSLLAVIPNLSDFDLLQIANNAPRTLVQLYCVLERCEERFVENDLNIMLSILNMHYANVSEQAR